MSAQFKHELTAFNLFKIFNHVFRNSDSEMIKLEHSTHCVTLITIAYSFQMQLYQML
jgi:hypothetical protein